MIRLKLNRYKLTKDYTLGTYQLLNEDGSLYRELKCLELAWKNNEPKVSCIPAGRYPVVKLSESASFKYTHFHIQNVPERSYIKIHRGNYTRQILGCQLPGLAHSDIDKDGIMDVVSSTDALNIMVDFLPEKFDILITEYRNSKPNEDTDANMKTI